MTLDCLCGQVRLRVDKTPEFVHACNCMLCTKSGAHWSYFHPSDVSVEGETRGYSRTDKAEPSAEIRFCPACGCTTHFVLTAAAAEKFGNTMMGVNMLLADEGELAGIERRYPDGRGWSGAGTFTYVREAQMIGS